MPKKKTSGKNTRAARQKDKLRKRQERLQVQQYFEYIPVDNQWRNEQILRLGLPFPLFNVNENNGDDIISLPLTDPTQFYEIIGDGNCFFNVISFIITGNQNHAFTMRRLICQFMRDNTDMINGFLPPEASGNIDNYLTQSKMEINQQWATEVEIYAASVLLQTNIFLYSRSGVHWKWLCFSTNNTQYRQGIYIYHKNGNHFDLVVSVVNSAMLPGISQNKCYSKDSVKLPSRSDPQFSEKHASSQKKYEKKQRDSNPNFVHKARKKLTEWYEKKSSDPEFKKQRAQSNKTSYNADKMIQQKKKAAQRMRYKVSQLYRQNKKIKTLNRYTPDPLLRKKIKNVLVLQYKLWENYREKKKASIMHKYKTCKEFREKVKAASRTRQVNQYKTSAKFRGKKKADSRLNYRTNDEFREGVKDYSRSKYETDEEFREKVKDYSHSKYETDEEFREKVKDYSRSKYKTDDEFHDKVKDYSCSKYEKDDEFREKVKDYSRSKYETDDKFREKVKDYSRSKYETNDEFREKVKDYSRSKYETNDEFREKVKDYSCSKYEKDDEFREKVKGYSRFMYKTSDEFRQKKRNTAHKRYRMDSLFRGKLKASSIKRYSSNPLFKSKLKTYLKQAYHQSSEIRENKKKAVKCRRQSITVPKAIRNFQKSILDTPEYVCTVCIRTLYKSQVKLCKRSKYMENGVLSEMAARCLTGSYVHQCDTNDCDCKFPSRKKEWICHTCHSHLSKSQMPPQAQANNLFLQEIPEVLGRLNGLERQLIALRIPFMKLLSLPRGGQRGVKGPVVNIPSDLNIVTTTLPRTAQDAQLVKVKLKRKLEYKGHYQYEWVNPKNVIEAVKYLIANNSWYSNVTFNEDWLDQADDDLIRDEPNDSDSEDEAMEVDKANTGSDFPVESCMQPLDPGQEYLDTGDKIFAVAPGENQRPQSMLTEEGVDAMAFPVSLPDGQHGLSANREVKLTPSKYFNVRLLSADKRFSSDNQFIFFAQYITELTDIISKMSIAMRKGKSSLDSGEKVTASMLQDSDNLKNILKSDEGFRFLQPIRGSPPYWQRTIKDLYAMIRQLGIPTWFITFSAGETRWEEVTKTLLTYTSDSRDVSEIEWLEKCKLIRENPVMCSRLFDHRVRCLFNDLLKSPSQPIGPIQDFFYRTEFQARGSPHIHSLFWIEGAPKLNIDSDVDICTFVDKYVTCELPDEEEDPELYDIVTSVQVHSRNHSRSCGKKGTVCRFHFPRPPIKETFLAKVDGEEPEQPTQSNSKPEMSLEELNKLCQKPVKSPKQILKEVWIVINALESDKSLTIDKVLELVNITYEEFQDALKAISSRNSIYYKRDLKDTWVNNYNKDLLRAWNANLDIQYVMDAYSCVAYILSYISKAEAEVGDLLNNAKQEAAEGNHDAATTMKKIGQTYLQSREISAQEAIYRVCSLHLKQCSRDVTFIPAGSKQLKMSLPISVIKSKRQEDENIWMKSIVEKYYARPLDPEFQNMCLAEFCSKYTILPPSKKPKASSRQTLPVFELQDDLGYIKQKTIGKESVIRYPRFNQVKQPEEYYMTQLQLFIPHRSADFKPPEYLTYEDYMRRGNVTETLNTNRKKFEIDSQEIENAWDDLQEGRIREEAWSLIGPESEAQRLDIEEEKGPSLPPDNELDEVPELVNAGERNPKHKNLNPSVEFQKPNMTTKQVNELMSKMNDVQQEIFYKIRNWCLQLIWKQNPPPFHLFLTGGAGTGKTHLIKCIYHEATHLIRSICNNPDAQPVILTAPTGTAAFNVEGNTIHSAFAISKNLTLPYVPLAENTLNTLRTKFEDFHILIIDEISMVDHKLLSYIHGRLCQIKQSRQYFGNTSVIAVGDFHQLPPVRASPLFKIKDTNFMDLWNPIFSVATLTEIMRQKDDVAFAQMLNRVRTHSKENPLSDDDLTMLRSVSYEKEHLPDESKEYLHIFPTNKEVDKHNTEMVQHLCQPVVTILANDFVKDYSSGELVKRDAPYHTNSNEDLLTSITIGLKARIMLTRNIDTKDGLVNGAFGTIEGMDKSTKGDIVAVYVKFDNPKSGKQHIAKSTAKNSLSRKFVRLVKVEESLHGRNVTRKQFPFKLGWAATIHKTQGMTVNNVVVSLEKIFQPGMAYVALSRATSLAGLIIIDFNPNVIYASSDILRSVENMPLFLEGTNNNEHNIEERKCSIVLHNTEGLIPHLNDVKSAKVMKTADIICFTETWLKKSQTLPNTLFPNMSLHLLSRSEAFQQNQTNRQRDPTSQLIKKLASMDRGGVAMLVHNDFPEHSFQRLVKNMECITCTFNDQLKLSLSVIYRSPEHDIGLFCEGLIQLLSKLDSQDRTTMLLGDFNDDIRKPSNIKAVFQNFGYTQLVHDPTTRHGTTLDCCYIKTSQTVPQVKVVPLYYSFHEAVEISLSF